ncbi:MAG TPA: inner membrane CreD family protein [Gemmatimonadaceae bacterium]|nr:inner membrane CreD family protein [Gemmatimonadaceae bacterium]
MVRRIVAILFIYGCTSVAWAILGATIFARTYDADSSLRSRVASSWGTAQKQSAPVAFVEREVRRDGAATPAGAAVPAPASGGATQPVMPPVARQVVREIEREELPVERSRVAVDLDLDQRQKGLLWYSTYGVRFAGRYLFRNTTDEDRVTLALRFPSREAIYDDLTFTVDGVAVPTITRGEEMLATVPLAPGATAELGVGYRSQGMTEWRYDFGGEVARVRDFEMRMTTDFDAIDFPANTLSPTAKRATDDGWELTWRYSNLLSGYQLGMTLPERLQPGPLAGRISFFAPVSLLFFFLLLFLITTVRGIELHPMNYFFLAGAFFAFHLLLAYLVDHMDIHLAFAIAAVVSVALVVSYLRIVVGPRFAFREAALAQIVYLVLFSYAFFFQGFTGLAITIGAVLTLFVTMQMTARVRWAERFAAAPGTPPVPPPAPPAAPGLRPA